MGLWSGARQSAGYAVVQCSKLNPSEWPMAAFISHAIFMKAQEPGLSPSHFSAPTWAPIESSAAWLGLHLGMEGSPACGPTWLIQVAEEELQWLQDIALQVLGQATLPSVWQEEPQGGRAQRVSIPLPAASPAVDFLL